MYILGFLFLLILCFIAALFGGLVAVLIPGEATPKRWLYCTMATIVLVFGVLKISSMSNSPMHVDAGNIYGAYEIDRNMFPGENAEWQYEKYSFVISEENVLHFFEETNGVPVFDCEIPIEILENGWGSDRLKITAGCHHVISSSPTLVREPWSFYYVFYSPHYGNMFFRKSKFW